MPSAAWFKRACGPYLIEHPLLDDGTRGFPHRMFGVELARDAFDDDHRLLQHDELGLHLHVEHARDFKNCVRRRAIDTLLAGRPKIGSPMARRACAKSSMEWRDGTKPTCKWMSATRR